MKRIKYNAIAATIIATTTITLSGVTSINNMKHHENVTQTKSIKYKNENMKSFKRFQEIKHVDLGTYHSAVVLNDGNSDSLYTFGNNGQGQLGLGWDYYNTMPVKVTELPDGEIKHLTTGNTYSGVVINDGTSDHLYTWGSNTKGQLGNYEASNGEPLPIEMTRLPDGEIKEIVFAGASSFAVVNDGTSDHLYCWGGNPDGQLGIGSHGNAHFLPAEVTGLPDGEIKHFTSGGSHSAAVINDGTSDHLYTWGGNWSGELGLGDETTNVFDSPMEVTGLPDGEIKHLSLGGAGHSGVVVNDGTSDHLYTWGNNESGQLGLGDYDNRIVPTEVTGLPDGEIEQLELGNSSSSMVINDGTSDHLYTWGINDKGQLGVGDYDNKSIPTEVNGLPDGEIEQLDLGVEHSSAVVNDGTYIHLYMWGDNGFNQRGTVHTAVDAKEPIETFTNSLESINTLTPNVKLESHKIIFWIILSIILLILILLIIVIVEVILVKKKKEKLKE